MVYIKAHRNLRFRYEDTSQHADMGLRLIEALIEIFVLNLGIVICTSQKSDFVNVCNGSFLALHTKRLRIDT